MRAPSMKLVSNQQHMARVLAGLGASSEVNSPTRTATEVRSPTSTSTEVRSPTSTSTEVRSPTSTSTDAYTRGNITVTGGAGAGAYTIVEIYQGAPSSHAERAGRAAGRTQENFARQYGRAAVAPRPGGTPAALRANVNASRPGGTPTALQGLGFAPSNADRNSSISLFQREQNRMRAALNLLVANAPEARAANPLLYENSIMQFNNLLGHAGEYFEQVVYTATEDMQMRAALDSYTSQVETLVSQVQQMVPQTGGPSGNPAPQVETGLPTPTVGPEQSTAPVTPVSATPGAIVPTVTAPMVLAKKRPTWTYYAFAGTGVLTVVGVLGLLFLKRKRRARR